MLTRTVMSRMRVWTVALLTPVMMAVTACGAFGERVNPVKAAVETGRPDLIAYALEGSYTIVQSNALAVARKPTTTPQAKDSIISIAERANPILDDVRPIAEEATKLTDQIESVKEAGGDPVEQQTRLAALLSDINRMLTEVAPMITELIASITGDGGEQP